MTAPPLPDEDLANINVIRDFSYTIATSSIVYVRNYNFNPITSTPIEVLLQNKSTLVPITVDISASHPWVTIINPTNNKSVVTPAGNVVLPISSSTVVLMNIDLPPQIEAIPDSNLQVSMSFYVRSGSFPILTGDEGTQGSQGSTSPNRMAFDTSVMYINPTEVIENTIRVYEDGILKSFGNDIDISFNVVTTFIDNDLIARVGTMYVNPSSGNYVVPVTGLSTGTATLRAVWYKSLTEILTAEVPVVVTSATNAGQTTGAQGSSTPGTDGERNSNGFTIE